MKPAIKHDKKAAPSKLMLAFPDKMSHILFRLLTRQRWLMTKPARNELEPDNE